MSGVENVSSFVSWVRDFDEVNLQGFQVSSSWQEPGGTIELVGGPRGKVEKDEVASVRGRIEGVMERRIGRRRIIYKGGGLDCGRRGRLERRGRLI